MIEIGLIKRDFVLKQFPLTKEFIGIIKGQAQQLLQTVTGPRELIDRIWNETPGE